MRLPDFLIIGAMKAGTSSVHRYLQQHPDVLASTRKEIDFFSRHYRRGLPWYMRQFGTGARVAGESSPNYLKAHLWPEVAARIHRDLPAVRLVCVLRNPVDRTLSHYLHNVWRGREARPFSRVVEAAGNIVATSRYGWQLGHYLGYFPPEQIALVTTEELDRDPQGTLQRLLRFIGVDGDTGAVDTSQRHNVTAANLADAGARVPDDPGLVADGDRIRMSAELRAALAERFRPDLDALRSSWPRFPGWDLDREPGQGPADGGS